MDIVKPYYVPPHISSLDLINFRGFKKEKNIPLAPLTFLVGANSAGKSSIFDAILLIAQSNSSIRKYKQKPKWEGPYVDLGSYSDAVYKHNIRLDIKIGVGYKKEIKSDVRKRDTKEIKVLYKLSTNKKDPVGDFSIIKVSDSETEDEVSFLYTENNYKFNFSGFTKKISFTSSIKKYPNADSFTEGVLKEIKNIISKKRDYGRYKFPYKRINDFLKYENFRYLLLHVQRVSSGRSAPKRWYSIADSSLTQTVRSLREEQKVFDTVTPNLIKFSDYHFFNPYKRRKKVINETLTDLLNKLDIAVKIQDFALSPYHVGINIVDSITKIKSNLIDVGYGASQVIPVIKAILSANEGPLLVEQPEIHLHPKAQGIIADFLCQNSADRQVIVETHSEHMINRARILVAEGKISSEQMIILFVYKDKSGSHVKPIPIDKNGEFKKEWPGGFFDERYQDTMKLMKLKNASGE